jgi:hypothetical protein
MQTDKSRQIMTKPTLPGKDIECWNLQTLTGDLNKLHGLIRGRLVLITVEELRVARHVARDEI